MAGHRKLAVTLIGIATLAACAIWVNRPQQDRVPLLDNEGVSEIITSTTAEPPAYALHILFIGNSYTYVHDMPRQMVELASADRGNTTQLFVQSVTRGGIGLKELWADGKALAAINKIRWDYVVLQEQSFWAMTTEGIEVTQDYAKRFIDAIKTTGAKPLLYLTWPRKAGSNWYREEKYRFLKSPEYMLQRFVHYTDVLATKMGASTVDAGIYWHNVQTQEPKIELYEPDGSHPSFAGSYLVALAFYKTLTGRDVTLIPYHPVAVPTRTAAKIREIIAAPLTQQP